MQSKGLPVTLKISRKEDLQRNFLEQRAQNAPPVARCTNQINTSTLPPLLRTHDMTGQRPHPSYGVAQLWKLGR